VYVGDRECIRYSQRDLSALKAATNLVRGWRAAVQAGGNVGIFPKWLTARFETVYTFEPDAELFEALMHNAPERNIVKLQAALGSERGCVSLSSIRRERTDKPAHKGLTHIAGAGVVPCLRLDDLALPACDLIYLDIEGWEYFALQGAADTIARCRPVIGVEINRYINYSGHTPEELREWLYAAHYAHAQTVISDEIYVPV
jgi:FkbM family methyltransferase